jgi:hypothetical protein
VRGRRADRQDAAGEHGAAIILFSEITFYIVSKIIAKNPSSESIMINYLNHERHLDLGHYSGEFDSEFRGPTDRWDDGGSSF